MAFPLRTPLRAGATTARNTRENHRTEVACRRFDDQATRNPMEILQPKVGDRVRVRQRTWTVRSMEPYERCRVLSLAGVAGSGITVIQPFDDVERLAERRTLRRVGIRAW